MERKCEFPEEMIVSPNGIYELDPCIYEEIERYENVTVIIRKCKNCGHIDISWLRQENTQEITDNDI